VGVRRGGRGRSAAHGEADAAMSGGRRGGGDERRPAGGKAKAATASVGVRQGGGVDQRRRLIARSPRALAETRSGGTDSQWPVRATPVAWLAIYAFVGSTWACNKLPTSFPLGELERCNYHSVRVKTWDGTHS
jgi:hypothetical protein